MADHTESTTALQNLFSMIASAKTKQRRTSANSLASRESETPSPTAPAGAGGDRPAAATGGGGDALTAWTERISAEGATASSDKAMLKLYLAATKDLSLDKYRKNDVFGHLWVCYARLLQRTGSSSDVSDTFKYMKSERIAQQLPYYFKARADFETSKANTAKSAELLAESESCPPATQAAQEQEEKFQLLLQRLDAGRGRTSTEEPLSFVESPVHDKEQRRDLDASLPPPSAPMQTPQNTSHPPKKASTTKRPIKRFGGIGMPLRVTKSSLDAVHELDKPKPTAPGPTEETTQVFFGNVSKTEIRAQKKASSVDTTFDAGVLRGTLGRRRTDGTPATSTRTHALSPLAGVEAKRKRLAPADTRVNPVAQDDVTADTIISFKQPIQRSTTSEDVTADTNTIVTFKTQASAQPGRRGGTSEDVTADTNTIVTFKKPEIARETPRGREQRSADDVTDSTIVAAVPTATPRAAAIARPHQTPTAASAAAAKAMPPPTVQERESISVAGVWYQKLSQIGKGGSSKVYKVISPDGEIFALKEIDLGKADDTAIEGYENEIELLQTLQGSAHIITLVGWERKSSPATLYIVMECGDADLSTALKERKKCGKAIDENCQRLYWQQMLEAVQAIHAVNIVHSDLKPANFILVKGVLKLIDFGIATQVQEDHTSALRDTAVGTLNYMAPEAITSQSALPTRRGEKQTLKITPAADVWSLGCILYSLAFGKTPFQHLNPYQKLQAIVSPDYKIEYPKTKNRALLDVLQSCLHRDPKKRPSITSLLQHKFLNPNSTANATPVRERQGLVHISEEQLRALLLEHGVVGGAASPEALRRRLHELESGPKASADAASAPTVKRAPPPPQRQAATRPGPAPLAQLDPNALSQRRQALKRVDKAAAKPKRTPLREVNDLQSIIQKGVRQKFCNVAPADQDTGALETAEWRTMEVE